MWFGAVGGVTRYDGASFIRYGEQDGFPSTRTFAGYHDREGGLWIGSQGRGVLRFDGHRVSTAIEGMERSVRTILEDSEGNMWFGLVGGGVSRYDGSEVTTWSAAEGFEGDVASILEDRGGHMWFGTLGQGVIQYDGDDFQSYSMQDGLPDNWVLSALEDQEGHLWFGTQTGGASYYDDQQFVTCDTRRGLADDWVYSMLADSSGSIWFGTDGGVSRYDVRQFTTFTVQDGLPHNTVTRILEDTKGNLWFGTHRGVIRFDGIGFSTLTHSDGSPRTTVLDMLEDHTGSVWVGMWYGEGVVRYDDGHSVTFDTEATPVLRRAGVIAEDEGGYLWFAGFSRGLSRYDGVHFTDYTMQDGLPGSLVYAMCQDRLGGLWLATDGGLCRYQDGEFTLVTADERLAGGRVWDMRTDREGNLWLGTDGAGVCRFDGLEFTYYTRQDGLAADQVRAIHQDRRGHLWFGTTGGVSRFDGVVFQSLCRQDGLANNMIWDIHDDRHGAIWIATTNGLTRYLGADRPPSIRVTDAIADRHYGAAEGIELPSSHGLLSFEFLGSSLTTDSDRMAYVYRLEGYESDWRPTHERRVEYAGLPVGEYVFQVKAVDRDLNYSDRPAEVRVSIHPAYMQMGLMVGLGISLVGLAGASASLARRRRERDQAREALVREMEQELQTAHDMQMGLMPTESPSVRGLDIASRCMPATQVGGDFFQYFHQGDRLSISTADVTDHGMEAAIPVVMFDGILDSQVEIAGELEDLFSRLNERMVSRMPGRTHVCFSMAQIDINTRAVRFANAGCPYPFHYRAGTGDIIELEADAYPLGVRTGTTYQAIETQLDPGDRLVFCSDGVMEAQDVGEEMFGFERTAEVIRTGCKEDLPAEGLLERVLGEVTAFSGDRPQEDDMTCVVVHVEV